MRTHKAINPRNDSLKFMASFSSATKLARLATAALVLVIWAFAPGREASCAEQERGSASLQTESSSFPDPNEVFDGKVFQNKLDRDVFFIRRIHENYPIHWPSLLEANIDVRSYVVIPDKLLRFIDHRGVATEAYPYNCNGSPQGITGLTTAATIWTVAAGTTDSGIDLDVPAAIFGACGLWHDVQPRRAMSPCLRSQ
jgi:hypothetical protein